MRILILVFIVLCLASPGCAFEVLGSGEVAADGVGYAVRATSNTSYGSITDSGTSDFDLTTYTLEAWIYNGTPTLDGNDTLISKESTYDLRVEGSVRLQNRTRIGGTDYYATDNSSLESESAGWHHVASIKSSSGVFLYMDGVLISSDTSASAQVDNDTSDSTIYFISGQYSFNYWTWAVDEMRVSDIARYTGSTYTVPTSAFTSDSNTIGLWHMEDGSGTTLTDSSSNGNDITLTGTFSLTDEGKF